MGSIAWRNIMYEGWPVLSVLLGFSIYSFAIMLEKWKMFSKIEKRPHAFLESIKKTDPQKVLAFCEKSDQPLAQITLRILKSANERDERERVLSRALQNVAGTLEHKLATLGTIAATAPFIGLLGTVIGIIKAFHAVAATTVGGASQVSIGIAEALVGTAGGLVVAIPASLAYNFFVNKLRLLMQDLETAGGDIVDWSLNSGGPR